MSDFRLPDLGEGLTEATIVSWHVAVGDTVTLNQPLAEVETAKALVELPSPRAGVITALHAAEGETLDVGAPLIGFAEEAAPAADGTAGPGTDPADSAGSAPAGGAGAGSASSANAAAGADDTASADPVAGAEAAADADASADAPADADATPARPQRQQVLVGYGPVLPGSGRPRRRPRTFPTEPYRGRSEEQAAAGTPKAMPPVRRHARDLGVDLASVTGTGPGGRILRGDVEVRAHGTGTTDSRSRGGPTGPTSTRVAVTGLRKQTARAMTESAFTAPHASVHTTIDVTDTLERLRGTDRDGRRTSFLAAVCRAIAPAVGRTPSANARFDAEAGEIEEFGELALGIAVATDRGLVVATVPGAETLDGPELTEQIRERADRARDGTLTPSELTGSTLTVTNVGVFGVEGGVPILNPGQSVILAVGGIRTQPWEHRGEVALRQVVTLTVSFDHRVLDGAEASRFLVDVADVVSDPAILLTR